jgi:hypothetical protein
MQGTKLTLTIPYPSYIPRARGINAVTKFGHKFKAACSKDEFELVQEAAHKLGLPVATFVRWCQVECAKQVLAGNEDHVQVTPPPEP